MREIASKIFGKMILKPLQFQKDFKSFPRMTAGTDKNFYIYHRLECICKGLKVLWMV